jgi:hypothetical protein
MDEAEPSAGGADPKQQHPQQQVPSNNDVMVH